VTVSIVPIRSATRRRISERAAEHELRRDLIRRGVPGHIVTSTPRAMLNHLDRATPDRPILVLDAEQPEDHCPNLATAPSPYMNDRDELAETFDEAQSTRFFLRSIRATASERRAMVAPQMSPFGGECA
jgi:hypothetical protein